MLKWWKEEESCFKKLREQWFLMYERKGGKKVKRRLRTSPLARHVNGIWWSNIYRSLHPPFTIHIYNSLSLTSKQDQRYPSFEIMDIAIAMLESSFE